MFQTTLQCFLISVRIISTMFVKIGRVVKSMGHKHKEKSFLYKNFYFKKKF